MAAGRSTDEPFWDNYRDIQIAGLSGAEVGARAHAHTHLLSLDPESSWHLQTAPPPLKQFNCSLIAFIIPLIQISAISSRLGRYAYHELFWHQDLLIFTSNISFHQSAPGVVLGRGGVKGWEPPHTHTHTHHRHSHRRRLLADPNHPEDNNELWPQLWAACVCMHLIKAPPDASCRRREEHAEQRDGLTQPGTSRISQ